MTTTHEAAWAELAPAGRDVTRDQMNRWMQAVPVYDWAEKKMVSRFDPAAPISALAGRLLNASNAIHPTKRILP